MQSNLKNNSGMSTFNLQLNQISLKLERARFIPRAKTPSEEEKQRSRKQTTSCLNVLTVARLTAALLPRNNIHNFP